jgi:nucleotide-binding universal stress UspA family protein
VVAMKKILVGLESSYRAHALLRAATAVALESNAQLVLFRAVSLPADFPVEALSIPPSETRQLLESRARHDLDLLARNLPAECKPVVVVIDDLPWRAICAAATREDVDMIFIGTHEPESHGQLLGSTASMVANHADRPVLIFRDQPGKHVHPETQEATVGG